MTVCYAQYIAEGSVLVIAVIKYGLVWLLSLYVCTVTLAVTQISWVGGGSLVELMVTFKMSFKMSDIN